MKARLLIVDSPDADLHERRVLDAAVDGLAPALRDTDVEALVKIVEAEPPLPALVVLAPGVDDPLAKARRLARAIVDVRFVFVLRADDVAAFRQRAVYAAPAGGRWSQARIDDPQLRDRIHTEFAAGVAQRRLRTTLDRMRVATRPDPLPEPGEYRRLVASDRYLASVLRHAHDAIVSLDPEGRVVAWNTGAELLFGIPASQARRRRFSELFRTPDATEAAVQSALAGSHRMAGLEIERSGNVRYVDANFGVLRDDALTIIGVVAILRDISERHRIEEELRASSREKDEFLAMLAHELRNPLAPVRSAAEVLSLLGHPDRRGTQAIEVIARQTGHLAGLIGDLLDVARVTRGAIVLEREPLLLADVLLDAIEQARRLIDSRGHHLSFDPGEASIAVLGDRKRLTQVVANLLVNAARYTPTGGDIRLKLRIDGPDALACVEDTGIGMAPELRERVFDLFVQGERTADRGEGGLGIGLSLVRSLVAAHGGSVLAHSEGPGRGSRFEVRLPLVDAPDASAGSPLARDEQQSPRLRLVVVDDNEDAARTLGALLQAMGHRAEVEIDPRIALDRAGRELPDAYILDIGMPHIDGYELARRLRALDGARGLTLIALTGYGHDADRERTRAAGFDHHLVKPVDARVLEQVLGQVGAALAERV